MSAATKTALVEMEPLPRTGGPDLTFDLGTFADTTATIAAVTPAGRRFMRERFGLGARSASVPKSDGLRLFGVAQSLGLLVA